MWPVAVSGKRASLLSSRPGTVFLHVDWNFRAPVRPGDVITGRVEVTEVRSDKPITKLKTTVVRDDGGVAVHGDALCYTMPLPS